MFHSKKTFNYSNEIIQNFKHFINIELINSLQENYQFYSIEKFEDKIEIFFIFYLEIFSFEMSTIFVKTSIHEGFKQQ